MNKWRPPLWMVIFGAVLTVALSPLVGLYIVLAIETWFAVDFRFHTIWDAGPVLAFTVLVGLALAWLALRLLLGPVRALIARTAEIERGAAGGFAPLAHYGTRELALLGERFLRLSRRLSQRNEDLVLFSRHLSHELKSPLTAIRGAVELLRDEPDMDAAQRDRFLLNIAADAERMGALADGLRTLARAELLADEGSADLRTVVTAIMTEEGLALSMDGDVRLDLSERSARIVFQQLATNAREQGAGTFVVRIEGDGILVGDDGPSIPIGDRGRILEPFFTTRRDRGGTGLGLAIASAVLVRHGARLRIADPGEAHKFEIRLGRSREAEGRAPHPPTGPPPCGPADRRPA